MADWLTVIIVLLILGILLDGWRRMRNAQRDSLKVSRSMRKSASASDSDTADDYRSAELPNGGARVVAYRDSSQDRPCDLSPQPPMDAPEPEEAAYEAEPGFDETGYDHADFDDTDYDERDGLEEPEDEPLSPGETPGRYGSEPQQPRQDLADGQRAGPAKEPEPQPHTEPQDDLDEAEVESATPAPSTRTVSRTEPRSETGKGRIPEQVALNLDDSVPILMETTENDATDQAADGRIEPTFGGGKPTPDPVDSVETDQGRKQAGPKDASAPSFGSALGSSLGQKAKQAKAALSAKLAEKAAQFNHTDSAPDEPEAVAEPAREPAPARAKPAPRKAPAKPAPSAPPQPEEVLVINVMAPKGKQFLGDALLDALMRAGLRYGDMNIFHCYEDERGGGAILFSLANMVKPGTFDLDAMSEFHTPGVSLFMTLPLEAQDLDNIDVFERMLESARSLVQDLGGELKDENRSVMTRQTMEHCRQRIHEFDRKQLSRSPH